MSVKITFKDNIELVNALNEMGTSGQATLESTTAPSMTVKDRHTKAPFESIFKGKIYRIKKEYVTMGISYENAVNNQRKREGITEEFEAVSNDTYKTINKYIIQHKETGEYYLRYYLEMNANYPHSEYIWCYADGTELTEAELNTLKSGFLSSKSGSSSQGTEKEIMVRQVKLSGVTRLALGGKEFVRKMIA
jgi:hypothetical protein